jgi:putative membrane protein
VKIQWSILLGIVFAFLIAIFAVINVDAVKVHYVFGTARWPLVLVILGSVVMGAIIVGAVGFVKMFSLRLENKRLEEELKVMRNRVVLPESNPANDMQKNSFKKTVPDTADTPDNPDSPIH